MIADISLFDKLRQRYSGSYSDEVWGNGPSLSIATRLLPVQVYLMSQRTAIYR